jgi:polar amino acid transport system substrate-binding protein
MSRADFALDPATQQKMRAVLAADGVLRVGLNMANFLLVSGTDDHNNPTGLSSDLARVPFKGPGELADAIDQDVWDLANIAVETERAETIAFSQPYIHIDANFMTRKGVDILNNDDVNQSGVRIILYDRSAYDLWLKDHYLRPEYIRVATIQESHDRFLAGQGDVLASLKPKLMNELAANSDVMLITDPFTYIKQAVGMKKGYDDVLDGLNWIITHLLANGFIADSLNRHGVADRLSLPSAV